MKRLLPFTLVVLALVVLTVGSAFAHDNHGAVRRQSAQHTWHGNYYHSSWGVPVALVVPPTAEFQTNWGWGVGNTRITPICPQFQRNYPGAGQYNVRTLRPTPYWPSDTTQFGVYYVRGPW